MASLAELYGRLKKNWPEQDFGPGDSMIASAIRNPAEAARRMYGSAIEGLPTMYDEPQTQLYKSLSSLVGMINPVGRQMPGTLAAINASHGSPHAFTKFRMANIGTGGGNQAYGHGLYFGEGFDSPVAKAYQKRVKDMASIQALNDRMTELLRIMDADNMVGYRKFKSDVGRNAANEYDKLLDERDTIVQAPGNLYNVSLRWPDAAKEAADPLGPQHFLDWDNPTPEAIKKTLSEKALTEFGSGLSGHSGKHDYKEIVNSFKWAGSADPKGDAIKWFSKQGIPGIRYADPDRGTSNYVVFDEDIPEIVTRNNRSLADLLRR